MSSAAVAAATGNDATKTHQISIPLPRSLDTRLYIHLTVRPKSILLMVTTASADEATTPTPLGSFVYAIPDVCFVSPLGIYISICISLTGHPKKNKVKKNHNPKVNHKKKPNDSLTNPKTLLSPSC